MRRSPDGRGLFVKVVIAGTPYAGKLSILEAVAARYGAAGVVKQQCGELATYLAEWSLHDRLSDGRVLHLTVLTVSGEVPYNAGEELLLRDADGVVFVIDVEPSKLSAAWEALLKVSDNAQRNGYQLREVPLALQYHRADLHPGLEPAKLDEWLGVPGGEVPRFVTSSQSPDLEGMAFDSVIAQMIRGIEGTRKTA